MHARWLCRESSASQSRRPLPNSCSARPENHTPCSYHANKSTKHHTMLMRAHKFIRFWYCRPCSSGGGDKDTVGVARAPSQARREFTLHTKLPQRSLPSKNTIAELDSPRDSEEEHIAPFSDWALHRLLGQCQVQLLSCLLLHQCHTCSRAELEAVVRVPLPPVPGSSVL